MKVGILGAGRIGKVHAKNIVSYIPDVEIKVMADIYAGEETVAWAKSIGVKNFTKNPEEVFADPEIDAVLICSSTDTHAQFILDAAAARKHIFCEKPIDYDLDRINACLAAVEKADVKLQIGFGRRFDHNHKHVYDTICAGKIGVPHIIKITSRDPEPPPISYVKVSGGLFFDMMIHDFDMARYLAGSEVEEVYAQGTVLVAPGIGEAGDVDTAIVMLKFKSGALGVIDNSRQAVYGYDQRVEVLGSKGCVQNFNDVLNTAVVSTALGVCCEKPIVNMFDRYNNAFITEMKAFVDSVRNNTKPPVTGFDGMVAVLIAEAANRSLKEARPVKITEL